MDTADLEHNNVNFGAEHELFGAFQASAAADGG
jgi:hypothetical protein